MTLLAGILSPIVLVHFYTITTEKESAPIYAILFIANVIQCVSYLFIYFPLVYNLIRKKTRNIREEHHKLMLFSKLPFLCFTYLSMISSLIVGGLIILLLFIPYQLHEYSFCLYLLEFATILSIFVYRPKSHLFVAKLVTYYFFVIRFRMWI